MRGECNIHKIIECNQIIRKELMRQLKEEFQGKKKVYLDSLLFDAVIIESTRLDYGLHSLKPHNQG